MFIPHNQKEINQLKIPIWTIACAIILFTVAVSSLTYLAIDFRAAKGDLDRLQYVAAVNQEQAQKIDDLIELTRDMESKIADIERLDREVRELVGLENDNNISPVSFNEEFDMGALPRGGVSRGQMISRPYESNMELLETLGRDLIILDQIVETKEESLAQLQVEVSGQLIYLSARPDFMPVNGRITSTFGYRRSPFGSGRSEFHNGIDIAAPHGTEIRAAGDGTVIFSGWSPGYGRTLSISHGFGYVSHYTHNSVNLVQVGDTVKKGELIARVGSTGRATGPHVHFMIDRNGERIDPQKVLN
jgi:murein DD-endopeptidase MepM/ murein hydrolase activator NlpD